MSWTDDRVDTLKRLWGEGLSASQIATQLGGVSRNAVIGKVHRLGLESRIKKEGEPAQTSDRTGDAPAAETAPAETVNEATGGTASETTAAPAETAPASAGADEDASTSAPPAPDNDPGTPASDAGSDDDVVIPVPLKLKLTQLTERTCKWPVGDPMHDDFHFCGHDAEEGRPYCEYHSGLAFQPASERRRVR